MASHKKTTLSVLWTALALAFAPAAFADNATLPQVVEAAVLHNPEVGAQFHNFQSGVEGQKVRRGALLPEVNLQGWTGREYRGSTSTNGSTDWSRSGYSLSLRQLLFDGFSTINDVRQLGFEKLADYYTLKATVDDLAQQATQAYLDVQRYREQVALAQQNYNLHKDILGQISERSSSGVGRGVDEVQAQARLALAQTNLMTASGNLNDVTQRYQRIIGQVPAETLTDAPDVDASLPKDPTDFSQSVRVSPTVLAKQALVQAAERGKASAQGRFSPTLELRAATGRDRSDPPYINDETTQSSNVQLMATFNLFRGGADAARVRQTSAQTYAARDVRDYTCRNVQQELSIAWNNVVRLRQQMPFLQQHERDIAQVRGLHAAVQDRPAHPAGPARHRKRTVRRPAGAHQRGLRPAHGGIPLARPVPPAAADAGAGRSLPGTARRGRQARVPRRGPQGLPDAAAGHPQPAAHPGQLPIRPQAARAGARRQIVRQGQWLELTFRCRN